MDMQCQKHIVVVDDEPGIRETIQEYLELHAFRVTAAGGGEALRRAIEANDVELVLLDIRMPGEDGLSLADRESGRQGRSVSVRVDIGGSLINNKKKDYT